MKNKFIYIFLIFAFNLTTFFLVKAEEFNFNTTELQITENGNLIKGIDGGTVSTVNNQIIISADNFQYNKITTLLEAQGNVRLIDKIADIVIESNKIFYLKNKEKIYTKGESKAISGIDIQIDADQYFKYNKLTSFLEAKGNVILNDKSKKIIIHTNEILYSMNEEKIFTLGKTNINAKDKYNINGQNMILLKSKMILSSDEKTIITDNNSNTYELSQFQYFINEEILKAEKIKITRNEEKNKTDQFFFQKGFFNLKENKFLGKDVDVIFHKALFDNEKNDPRISSVSAYGDEFNTYLEKGVFTSCKKNDKCPPWKIRASTINHNKIKKQIIYRNAWLDLYDFPVFYFPKFFHPDPSVKRQSGILTPEIGNHDTLGDSIYLPYFLALSENTDITIKPRLFNNNIYLLQNEYRQKTKRSLTIIDSSITKGHDSSNNDEGDTRSHFFANSKIDLDLKKYITSDLEINYEKSSNDNYLKLFNFIESPLLLENNDVLESIIKLDLEHENYDFTTSFEMYETLNGTNSDRYQFVLPSFNFSNNFSKEKLNGSFNFNSSGKNTLTETNVTTSTLFNDLNFSSTNYFSDIGIKSNFDLYFKNVNSIGKKSAIYKNSLQSELMSSYHYNISLPLVKNNKNTNNKLIPKVSFRVSPHEMKNNSNTERRINIDNIFASNRLSLEDSYETGESMTMGIDFIKEKINIQNEITEIEEYFDFKLATVLRFNKEKNIPINSTLNKKKSNIFGQTNFRPNDFISLSYNFSLTDDLDTFQYNALNAKFNYNNFSTQFNFLEERGVIGQTNLIENTTEYNFKENNFITFNTRKNRNLNLTEYYDIVYEYKNDCLIAGIKYKKDYYNDADIKPKEELFFSITIIPFYTYSPNKMILNKGRAD